MQYITGDSIPFADVEAGNTGISSDGRLFKIYGKGSGKFWLDNAEEFKKYNVKLPEFSEEIENVNFVYGSFENTGHQNVSIEPYGTNINVYRCLF